VMHNDSRQDRSEMGDARRACKIRSCMSRRSTRDLEQKYAEIDGFQFQTPGHVIGSMSLGVCWWARAAVASSSR
jgi:hypothetical protein